MAQGCVTKSESESEGKDSDYRRSITFTFANSIPCAPNEATLVLIIHAQVLKVVAAHYFCTMLDRSRFSPLTTCPQVETSDFLILSSARVLVLSREDHGSSVSAGESLCSDWGAVRPDGGANGHEEAAGNVRT